MLYGHAKTSSHRTDPMTPANPINLTHIDHVVIRVNDLDRAIAFYRDVLGCRLERGPGDSGPAQLRAGHSLIDLVDAAGRLGAQGGRPPDHGAPNLDHVCFEVESMEYGDGPRALASPRHSRPTMRTNALRCRGYGAIRLHRRSRRQHDRAERARPGLAFRRTRRSDSRAGTAGETAWLRAYASTGYPVVQAACGRRNS